MTVPVPDLRREYYFELHRLCGLKDPDIGALMLTDFANLINQIDLRLKHEVQLASLGQRIL
jgi:hypothetical protein